jgi:hypothetical protein
LIVALLLQVVVHAVASRCIDSVGAYFQRGFSRVFLRNKIFLLHGDKMTDLLRV